MLPLMYMTLAHVSLLLATAIVAFDPVSVTGYFYHPFMIGVVHLVTLGWISSSILGVIFIVGPVAMRMPMPIRRLDYWSFAFYAIGVSGIVSHFWIEQYSGMAWSASMVVLAVAQVAARVLSQLLRSSSPPAVRAAVGFACVNLVAAGTLGVLIGADREMEVVPGSAIANVYAHAHLAGLGWATLIVIGVGGWLLPLVQSSTGPTGARFVVTAVLIEVGVLGLCATLLVTGEAGVMWVMLTVAGLVTLLWCVPWVRRQSASPWGRSPPDWAARHATQSLLYLFLAAALGLLLVLSPLATWTARVAMLYGTIALLGFLSQAVIGMEQRVLPWLRSLGNVHPEGDTPPSPSPPQSAQATRATVFWLWTVGVPLVAFGFLIESPTVVGAGGWVLLGATVVHSFTTVVIIRRLG